MREALTFPCGVDTLVASLDRSTGPVGLLIVTGGTQTRAGPHRMMADLAIQAAAQGHPVFRFDRRGCGDSEGNDPGFRNSKPDLAAAALAFRTAVPSLGPIIGIGLCDGATALMLHHEALALDGLILINPLMVETIPYQLPPAAIRRRYAERLLTRAGWQQTLRRGFHPMKVVRGLRQAYGTADTSLAQACATSLQAFEGHITILLADGDGTAQGFDVAWKSSDFVLIRYRENTKVRRWNTASHSFARIEDRNWLTATILSILSEAGPSADPA